MTTDTPVYDYLTVQYRGKDDFPTFCAICRAPIFAGKKSTWDTYFRKQQQPH